MKIPVKIIGIKQVDMILNAVLLIAGLFAIGFALGVIFGLWENLI